MINCRHILTHGEWALLISWCFLISIALYYLFIYNAWPSFLSTCFLNLQVFDKHYYQMHVRFSDMFLNIIRCHHILIYSERFYFKLFLMLLAYYYLFIYGAWPLFRFTCFLDFQQILLLHKWKGVKGCIQVQFCSSRPARQTSWRPRPRWQPTMLLVFLLYY